MATSEQTSSFTAFCKHSVFQPAILNPLHHAFHQPKSRCHHSRNKASLSKWGHFYNYVHFSITLYFGDLTSHHAACQDPQNEKLLLATFCLHFVTPKVLTVVMVNTQGLWDVMPCQLLHTYRCFCGAYSLHLLVLSAT